MSNESIYGVRLSNDFIAICIASCVRSIEGVIDFDDSIPQNLSINMLKREAKASRGVKLYKKKRCIRYRSIHYRCIRRANSTASLADTENCKKLC